MRRFLNISVLALSTSVAIAAPPAFSLYTKLKNNTQGVWQQETGASAVWKRMGNLSLESNLAFVVRWPFRDSNVTGYTAGFTVRYFVGAKDDAMRPAIYTKIKHDLFHTWQQETGVSCQLWKQDKWSLGFNGGFIYSYPIDIRHHLAAYTLGLTLSRRF